MGWSYTFFFVVPFVQRSVRRYQLAMLIYDPQTQEIVQWIP